MHRASDRGEETAGGFLMGKYVMKKSVMITVILSCILALFGHVIFGWLTSNAEIIKMGGYHSGYRYCAGDRASCQYLRDEMRCVRQAM